MAKSQERRMDMSKIDYFKYFGETSAKKVRQKLTELVDDEHGIKKLKEYLIENDADFNRDLFIEFFEAEVAERKSSKQDYTAPELARLLYMLRPDGTSYYDPTAGTGSLLIEPLNAGKRVSYNEYDAEAAAFGKLNAELRGKQFEHYTISDALKIQDDIKYDTILSNPPYSLKYDPEDCNFELFKQAGKKAPKSKADYAFIAMIMDRLTDDGTALVILPHGVLFRGNAEGKLREQLIKNNWVDAIIGMPSNLFSGTGIPVAILVLKKHRSSEDVLFIDASNDFEKAKNMNILRDEDLNKIVNTYNERKDVDKYAYVAQLSELEENDFNLSIPRYVDTFEEEEPVDVEALVNDLTELDAEETRLKSELTQTAKELVGTNQEGVKTLRAIKAALELL